MHHRSSEPIGSITRQIRVVRLQRARMRATMQSRRRYRRAKEIRETTKPKVVALARARLVSA